jgi:hypothetical protein
MASKAKALANLLADGKVGTAELADGSITAVKILDGTISTADMADDAITNPKIADGAVHTANIADGAVHTAKLADTAVHTSKLADGVVTTDKIAAAAVTADKLAAGAAVPDQTGHAGQFLTTDGTDASWATVEALPDAIDVHPSAPADSLTIGSAGILRSNAPSGFWSGGTYIDNNGYGAFTSHGSYSLSIVANGYRKSDGTWQSFNVNNWNGAASLEVNPFGYVRIGTEANKVTGAPSAITTRFLVDRDGYITMPNQPTINLWHSASEAPATGVRFVEWTASDAQGGITEASGLVTVPCAGMYQVTVGLLSDGASPVGLYLRKNGVIQGRMGYTDRGSSNYEWTGSTIFISMSAYDTLDITQQTNNQTWYGSASNSGRLGNFSVRLVG